LQCVVLQLCPAPARHFSHVGPVRAFPGTVARRRTAGRVPALKRLPTHSSEPGDRFGRSRSSLVGRLSPREADPAGGVFPWPVPALFTVFRGTGTEERPLDHHGPSPPTTSLTCPSPRCFTASAISLQGGQPRSPRRFDRWAVGRLTKRW